MVCSRILKTTAVVKQISYTGLFYGNWS